MNALAMIARCRPQSTIEPVLRWDESQQVTGRGDAPSTGAEFLRPSDTGIADTVPLPPMACEDAGWD